jgi:glycosyltransferase involved in cell wall biosynthesis
LKKYIYCGDDQAVKIISTSKFDVVNQENEIVETENSIDLNEVNRVEVPKKKVAYICNWNQQCGISTYSKFIYDELKNKIETQIFSEYSTNTEEGIIYCWKRGEYLSNLIEELKAYRPTTILIQHEWGIFPNAGYFMSFIVELKRLGIPIVVVLHSVYDHLDKLLPISVLEHVIVHSQTAKSLLENLKFKGNVYVIPHGCPDITEKKEIYNIFQTPYLIFGYGFGFKYKGVETAIDAIEHLVKGDPKFKNLLYIYVCSESENNKGIHANYYDILFNKVKEAGLQNNILLLKGFLEPELLDTYLRTVKMVIFPYVTDPNGVCGSSGAIKIAMSYNIPVIASTSHLFDDVEGYVLRTSDHFELAKEIDKIFSNGNYREEVIYKAHTFIKNNTWPISADRYLNVIREIEI